MDGDRIRQLFDKYFEEASNTDVMGLRRLSRRAVRKAAISFDLYHDLLGTRALRILQEARANAEDELEIIVRILWSWQWALAEKVCPDLLPKAAAADHPRPGPKERKPDSIRRLEKRREEVREDLVRFMAFADAQGRRQSSASREEKVEAAW